jgi:hypothetical protein
VGEDTYLALWPTWADNNKATTNHPGYIISYNGNIKYEDKADHSETQSNKHRKKNLALFC